MAVGSQELGDFGASSLEIPVEIADGLDGESILASSYKNLAVWQKAHRLTLDIYQASTALPKDEMYGLSSQIKRAAASIPANIAEGSGRGSDGELVRFLRIAMGSAYELEYHILLAHDLGFVGESDYKQLDKQVDEVIRMLAGLIKSLNTQK